MQLDLNGLETPAAQKEQSAIQENDCQECDCFCNGVAAPRLVKIIEQLFVHR